MVANFAPAHLSVRAADRCDNTQLPPHCRRSASNVGFSIAASVKPFLVTSCDIPSARRSALADVAARGSCFSSRLARGHLMMG